jgi:hypothetical protein
LKIEIVVSLSDLKNYRQDLPDYLDGCAFPEERHISNVLPAGTLCFGGRG